MPCVISDYIPSDAVLTELVTVLPLTPKRWIDILLSKEGKRIPQSYEIVKAKGFDVKAMVDRIYRLYKGQ